MHHFFLTLCLATSLFGVAEARTSSEKDEPNSIIITPASGDIIPGNRAPAVVPINGYVDSLTDVVVLNFTQSCGVVQISFNNLSDGSYYSTSINGTGTVIIPIGLSSGSWTVTFTLSNGDVYIGIFTI